MCLFRIFTVLVRFTIYAPYTVPKPKPTSSCTMHHHMVEVFWNYTVYVKLFSRKNELIPTIQDFSHFVAVSQIPISERYASLFIINSLRDKVPTPPLISFRGDLIVWHRSSIMVRPEDLGMSMTSRRWAAEFNFTSRYFRRENSI